MEKLTESFLAFWISTIQREESNKNVLGLVQTLASSLICKRCVFLFFKFECKCESLKSKPVNTPKLNMLPEVLGCT